MSRWRGAPPELFQRMVPAVGSLRPAISRSAVDLPQPDGPSTETNSLGYTARSRPPSASTPLAKRFVTPCSATTGGFVVDRDDEGGSVSTVCPSVGRDRPARNIPLCAWRETGSRRHPLASGWARHLIPGRAIFGFQARRSMFRNCPMSESPPDRLSSDPSSPFFDAALLDRGVG